MRNTPIALLVLASVLAGQSGGAGILAVSPSSASPGEIVTVSGEGFGLQPGWAVVSGLRVEPLVCSPNQITFVVPEEGASGFVYLRLAGDTASNHEYIFAHVCTP